MNGRHILAAGLTDLALFAAVAAALQGCALDPRSRSSAPPIGEVQSMSATRVAQSAATTTSRRLVLPTREPGGAPECCALVTASAGARREGQDASGGACGYVATSLSKGCGWVKDQSTGLPFASVELSSPGADGAAGTADDVVIATGTGADGCFQLPRLAYPATYSLKVTDAPSATLACDSDGGTIGEIAFDLTDEAPVLGPLVFGATGQ